MHSKESCRDKGSSPQSALDFLLGSLGPMPQSRGSGRRRFQEEVEALQQWASSCGRCLINDDGLRGFKPVASGAEHDVFFDEVGQRAIKVTRDGRFGHSLEGEGLSATPTAYLQRLILHNDLLGDHVEVLGVWSTEGSARIISSQPWVTEAEVGVVLTQSDITAWFSDLGFELFVCAEVPAYYRSGWDVVVLDANVKNVLCDTSGRLFPIDVVIGVPGQKVRQMFGLPPAQAPSARR